MPFRGFRVKDARAIKRCRNAVTHVLRSDVLLKFRLIHQSRGLFPGAAENQFSSRRVNPVRQVFERLKTRGAPPDRLARLKAPAGLDIGAVTPEEIAVSILAEIIQHRRGQKLGGAEPELPATVAVRIESRDPICGMTVDSVTAKYRSELSERTVYFCCRHCKEMFDQDPERYRAAL